MELGHRDQHLSQPPIDRSIAGPSYEDLMKRDSSIIGAGSVIGSNPSPDVNPPTSAIQRPSIALSASETQPSTTFRPALPSTTTVVSSSPQGKAKLTFGRKLKLQKNKPMASTTNTAPVFRSDKRLKKAKRREARMEELHVDRRPPTTAVLQPLHRYCLTEGFVKPYRAHHCRSCGAVSYIGPLCAFSPFYSASSVYWNMIIIALVIPALEPLWLL